MKPLRYGALLGGWIAKLRGHIRVTQAELGRRVGAHSVTVSRWERGICSPRVPQLVHLARLAAVSGFCERLPLFEAAPAAPAAPAPAPMTAD